MLRKNPLRRQCTIESLERRDVCAAWQNADLPCDANASDLVTPIDALVVINAINRDGIRELSSISRSDGDPYLDANGDNALSPLDPLTIINAINRNLQPLSLTASVLASDDPNFNSVLLGTQMNVQGNTSSRARVIIRRADASNDEQSIVWQGTSDQHGLFETVLAVGPGANTYQVETRDELGRKTTFTKTWFGGDVVADWNATMLNAVRDWTGLSNDPYPNRTVHSRPGIAAKNLAMVHTAMFDAANAVVGRYQPYLRDLPRDPQASPIAAMATAAHRVAEQLYSDADEIPVLDATLAASLALVDEGDAKTRGIQLGEVVAQRMLAAREADGSMSPHNYVPSNLPGRWARTSPDFIPPEIPQWSQVKPFTLDDITSLRVGPPPALDSVEYAAAVDEVMRLGRIDSSERTADQAIIASFWADGPGTATPPGHWNRIASDQLMKRGDDLLDNARALAMLNLAVADAAIAAWDVKYLYDYWRPIHAITQADQDENPLTTSDSTWLPLLRNPPHPSYVSGHSTFSSAAATVLTHLFGENVAFSSTTDPQSGLTQRPLAPELIATRDFTSFEQAADEAGMSRVYGGIHFQFDNSAGQILGSAVGESVIASWLRRIDTE